MTFIEEILNAKLHFLSSATQIISLFFVPVISTFFFFRTMSPSFFQAISLLFFRTISPLVFTEFLLLQQFLLSFLKSFSFCNNFSFLFQTICHFFIQFFFSFHEKIFPEKNSSLFSGIFSVFKTNNTKQKKTIWSRDT